MFDKRVNLESCDNYKEELNNVSALIKEVAKLKANINNRVNTQIIKMIL